MRAMAQHEVPVIYYQVKEDYYTPGRTSQIRQDSEAEPFYFAVAIASKNDMSNLNRQAAQVNGTELESE